MGNPRIAILASGRGTNFEAVVRALRKQVDIVALVCDRPGAPVLARAKRLRVPALVVEHGTLTRDEHDAAVLRAVGPVDWLVLAGWKRIFGAKIFESFRSCQSVNLVRGGRGASPAEVDSSSTSHAPPAAPWFRIINIHPSLLPSFKGLNSYAQAYHYGCKVTGVTVHLVTPGVDEGPICAQEAFDISKAKSPKQVEARGLKIENKLYPKTLKWVLAKKFRLVKTQDGRLIVHPS